MGGGGGLQRHTYVYMCVFKKGVYCVPLFYDDVPRSLLANLRHRRLAYHSHLAKPSTPPPEPTEPIPTVNTPFETEMHTRNEKRK